MHAILTKIISRNGVEISTYVLLTVLRIFLMVLVGRIYFNVNEILPLVIICFQSSTWIFWSGSVIVGRNYMLVTIELWKKSFILTMYIAWLLYACDMLFLGGGGNFFLQEFFSWVQALHEFYFTSLQYISLLCVAVHDLYFFYKSCAGIFFRIRPIPPPLTLKNKMVRL